MEHLIFFSYILLFSSGFAGIVSLFYLQHRVRRASLPFFIVVQTSYLVGLGLQAVVFYLRNVARSDSGAGYAGLWESLVILSGFAGAALYWFSWLALRSEGYLRTKRCPLPFLPRTAGVSVFAAACLMTAALILHIAGISLRPPPVVSYLPATLAILSTGMLLILVRFSDEPVPYRLLLRGYGVSLLIFVPLTFLEMALQARVSALKPLSLDFLFFFMWNCVSIAAAFRSLAPMRSQVPALLDSVPEGLALRYGLSPRECEMILMIAKGLPNKGIAAELGLSPSTVRTHIYNLFQKVGARSRIELFALLKSGDRSEH